MAKRKAKKTKILKSFVIISLNGRSPTILVVEPVIEPVLEPVIEDVAEKVSNTLPNRKPEVKNNSVYHTVC
jgi:hypothetical protein